MNRRERACYVAHGKEEVRDISAMRCSTGEKAPDSTIWEVAVLQLVLQRIAESFTIDAFEDVARNQCFLEGAQEDVVKNLAAPMIFFEGVVDSFKEE